MRLRRQGVTFVDIGARLGISGPAAHKLYSAALKEIPAEEVALYRAEQAERLDEMLRHAYEVLGREHVTVSQGRVVRMGKPFIDEETGEATIDDGRGSPILDDGPTLAAIKTILAIEERRAKLLGMDTPVKQHIDVDSTVRYEVVGVDMDQVT